MTISRQAPGLGIMMILGLALAFIPGCGKPQAAPQNQQLISSLRTAVNTRNADWLEENANVLEKRRVAGKVSDSEYEEFQAIIAKARAGAWEEAERETIAFQKDQRPTDEEIERVKRPNK